MQKSRFFLVLRPMRNPRMYYMNAKCTMQSCVPLHDVGVFHSLPHQHRFKSTRINIPHKFLLSAWASHAHCVGLRLAIRYANFGINYAQMDITLRHTSSHQSSTDGQVECINKFGGSFATLFQESSHRLGRMARLCWVRSEQYYQLMACHHSQMYFTTILDHRQTLNCFKICHSKLSWMKYGKTTHKDTCMS